ncbi:MAG: hypothetical protein V4549_18000 [Bacteroidota bacterium]
MKTKEKQKKVAKTIIILESAFKNIEKEAIKQKRAPHFIMADAVETKYSK